MTATATPALTIEQLETAILADVVTRFANLRESTSRFSLLVKFEGQPAWQAIGNLVVRNLIRNKAVNKRTAEEEYLPRAAAFEFCGNKQLRDQARFATTVVLRTLKQMFKGERKRDGLTFEDLERHVEDLEPDTLIESAILKLGLYLSTDFHVLSYSSSPDSLEVTSFQISEAAITMANPDAEWDRVMAGFQPILRRVGENGGRAVEALPEWERITPLGGGGQSDVFLVRSPER